MAKTGRTRAEAEAPLLAANPQGRFVELDEVAASVLWLCSDARRLGHRPGDRHHGRGV